MDTARGGTAHPSAAGRVLLLQTLVFLSSWLLFLIELILGKLLLPGFGGGYMVWGISVAFYQALLFLGYAHIHYCQRHFRFARCRQWQTALLLLSLLCLPVQAERLQHPSYSLPLVIEIMLLLTVAIGFLFFLLAGFSIYVQLHLGASALPEKKDPYVLYAASNLGAFAALLAYPLLIEPFFDIAAQLRLWEAGYVALALLFLLMLKAVPVAPEEDARPPADDGRLDKRAALVWLLLSAAPSALFLSVTNLITFDVASVPLFWILPLAVYLLTLTLAFKSRPWSPSWLERRFYLAMHVGILLYIFKMTGFSVHAHLDFVLMQLQLPYFILATAAEPVAQLVICFAVCLVCHNHLHAARPERRSHLTAFYLIISAGGFLGGAIVNWLTPLLFNTLIEPLPAFLLATLALHLRAPAAAALDRRFWITAAAILLIAFAAANLNGFFDKNLAQTLAPFLASGALIALFLLRGRHLQVSLVLAALTAMSLFIDRVNFNVATQFRLRNYYGIYKVFDQNGFRTLQHGTTTHGAQFLDPARQLEPLTYYHKTSPAGGFLARNPLNATRVGLVGLGAGSLAAYARPGDLYDIFELDPLVAEVAKKYFAFLPNSRAALRYFFGDARLTLRARDSGFYDALIVDVFSSDAIPTHLMTVEAVREYLTRLRPGGAVFFHVSNQFVDLVPVLYAIAAELHIYSCLKETIAENPPEQSATRWVALTADPATRVLLQRELGWWGAVPRAAKPWTDRYSSILAELY